MSALPRMNSLDPRAKRFRAADRSIQQAKGALAGAQLALQDVPRSSLSPLTASLGKLDEALVALDEAAALLDEARMEEVVED